MSSQSQASLPYRPCVGVMLVNKSGKVFVGRRIDSEARLGDDEVWWQMPQGGVDDGEDLEEAAWRELGEETGVTRDVATFLKRTADPIRYDLPDDLAGKLWGGKFRGQEQIWFLARFTGEDSDIDLEAHDPPEFCKWKWIDPDGLTGVIVPFKKHVYTAILNEFRELI